MLGAVRPALLAPSATSPACWRRAPLLVSARPGWSTGVSSSYLIILRLSPFPTHPLHLLATSLWLSTASPILCLFFGASLCSLSLLTHPAWVLGLFCNC